MNFIGYLSMYMRVTLEDGEVCYVGTNMDFTKPALTEELLEKYLEACKCQVEHMGYKVAEIDYCTKEEYEANQDYDSTTIMKWGEEDS